MGDAGRIGRDLETLALWLDKADRDAGLAGFRYEETTAGREVDRVFTLVALGLAELSATFARLAAERDAFVIEERVGPWWEG
jgi:hypothetical protein